jgi:AAA family ATP:ADP antiporter
MAAAGFFCLMCGYYTLRPMREALALEVGVQYNSILFSVVLICSAALLPIYWWMVGRTPRGRLLWYVCTPFAAVFIALAIGLHWYPRDKSLAFAYFVALTSANLYVLSMFWSAMADVWRPELAKRFYGYIAAGGSAGALLGPFIVRSLVHCIGPTPLILFACASSMATAGLVSLARSSLRRSANGQAVPDGAIPVGGRALDDLGRLVRTPYLLGIAGVIIAGQTIGAFLYNEQGKYVSTAYTSIADRTAIFADRVALLRVSDVSVVIGHADDRAHHLGDFLYRVGDTEVTGVECWALTFHCTSSGHSNISKVVRPPSAQ